MNPIVLGRLELRNTPELVAAWFRVVAAAREVKRLHEAAVAAPGGLTFNKPNAPAARVIASQLIYTQEVAMFKERLREERN